MVLECLVLLEVRLVLVLLVDLDPLGSQLVLVLLEFQLVRALLEVQLRLQFLEGLFLLVRLEVLLLLVRLEVLLLLEDLVKYLSVRPSTDRRLVL